MKFKYFFTTAALSLLLSVAAKANTGIPKEKNEEETVNGMVMDMDTRKPLKDVNITAIINSKKEKIVSTDLAGGYTFIMLKPGTYKIIFEKEGYKKVVKEKIQVKEHAPVQLNVDMEEMNIMLERGPSAWHFFDS